MIRPILVTGGAGFVGSALIRRLIETSDASVVNVDCLTHASSTLALEAIAPSPRYSFEQVDICDAGAVRSVLQRYRPRAVIHLARESRVERDADASLHFIHTNVVGTCTVLAESRRYLTRSSDREAADFRFLHVSTDEAFGSLGARGASTETTPHRPDTPYAASRAAAEHFVGAWSRAYDLPTIIATCSKGYGPFQRPDARIPGLILRALERRPLKVYGDGRDTVDWMFIDDKVDALLTILERARVGQSYCVGARAERQAVQVVTAVCDLLDELRPRGDGRSFRSQIRFLPDRRSLPRRCASDTTKIETELGWLPRESFESGLRKTVAWYLEHQGWCATVRETAGRALPLGVGVPA